MASVLQKCAKFVSTAPHQVNLKIIPHQPHHGIHYQYYPRVLSSHKFKMIKNTRFLSTSHPLLYSEAIITGVKATNAIAVDTITTDAVAMDAIATEARVNLTSYGEETLPKKITELKHGGQIRVPKAIKAATTINRTDFKKLSERILSKSYITERDLYYLQSISIERLNVPTQEKITIVKDLWRQLDSHYDAEVKPPIRNKVLSFLIENEFDVDPKEMLQETFSRCQHGPNIKTYKLLASAYGKKGDLVRTVNMAELLIEMGGEMDETMYESIIQASCKSGDMDGAREILTSMKKAFPNPIESSISSPYHLFINSYAELGDLKRIDDTLQEMEKYHISPPSTIYLQMLDHLLLGGNIELLDDVLAKLSAAGLTASDLQYVIEKCLQRGEGDVAITLLLKSTSSLKESDQLRRNLAGLLGRSTDPNRALDLFCSYNTQLGLPPLTGIRHFFSKFGGVSQNLKELQLVSILEHPYFVDNELTGSDFFELCRTLAKDKNVEALFNVYCILLGKGIKLHDFVFQPMLSYFGEPTSCEYHHFFDLAKSVPDLVIPGGVTKEILSKMELFTLEQLLNMLPSLHFTSMFRYKSKILAKIVAEFDIALATDIVSYFHENGDQRVDDLIGSIIEQLLSIQKINKEIAFELAKEARGKGVPINNLGYSFLLTFLQKADDSTRFYTVVGWMKEQGLKPNSAHLLTMLLMAGNRGYSMSAQYCYNQLRLSNLVRNERTVYEALILSYSNDKTIGSSARSKSTQYYKEMLAKGLSPTKDIVSMFNNSNSK